MMFALFGGLSIVGKLIAVAVLVGSVMTAYEVWRYNIYMKGWRAHEYGVAVQDEKVVKATRKARDNIAECKSDPRMRWEQSTRLCVGR